jgi:hypothetical protein
MTTSEANAMIKAWVDWHGDLSGEDIPAVNLSFEKGFNAALEFKAEETAGFISQINADRHQALDWKRGFERYEKLRKLSPRNFMELWHRSLGGERFDDLVDRIKK